MLSLILGLIFSLTGLFIILGLVITDTIVLSANNIVVIIAIALIVAGIIIIGKRYGALTKERQSTPLDQAALQDLGSDEVKLVGMAKAYPKISLADIASKLKIPERNAETMLVQLVAQGVIRGRIDPGTKEFISGMVQHVDAQPATIKIVQCPYCGAGLNTSLVKGASVKCGACGQLISTS